MGSRTLTQAERVCLTCCHYITQRRDSKHSLDRLPRTVCVWTCEWRVYAFVCMRACVYLCVRAHIHAPKSALWANAVIWVGFSKLWLCYVCVFACVWVRVCVCCHRAVSAALIAVYLVCGLTQSLAVRSTTDSSVFIGSLRPYQH